MKWIIFLMMCSLAYAQTNPDLVDLADNTAMDLGEFICTPTHENDLCGGVTDYSGMVYDQNNHQILMFGGGHATTFTDTIFVFDPDTLEWTELYPPTPCSEMDEDNVNRTIAAWINGPAGPYPRPLSRHTYDSLVVADGINELIMTYGPNGASWSCTGDKDIMAWGKIAHFKLDTNTWYWTDAIPGGDNECPGNEYDPVSKKIIMFGIHGLWTYDPVTGIKMQHVDGSRGNHWNDWGRDMGYATEFVYFPPNDRFYHFDRILSEAWEISLDRSDLSQSNVTRLTTTGEYPAHYEPGFAYDSHNQIIGGAITDNYFYAFDPMTLSWSKHRINGDPGTQSFHALEYDPINNVYVFITDPWSNKRTWIYRYASGTPPEYYCGDDRCINENCTTCSVDCGNCTIECVHSAEIEPCDGIVDTSEMVAFINKWKLGIVLTNDLMEAIRIWKG